MKYKLSLITVCYNAEKTIKDCIDSVLCNSHEGIEYLIIDGNSKDNTLEIINSYKKKFESAGTPVTIVSEQDNGLYDAMNKGINLSAGEWIWFINSDDFLEKGAVKIFLDHLNKADFDYDIVYGMLLKISDKIIYQVGKRDLSNASKNTTFSHPATAVRKDCFFKFGDFNTEYKMCADYDFFTRLCFNNLKVLYIEKKLAYMREGGVSDKLSSYIRRGKEHFAIDVKYYGYSTAILNSINFFLVGLTKKLVKEFLIKMNNEYFLKKYYQTKYTNVDSRASD